MSILDSAIETRDYDLYLNTYGLEGEQDFELYINKFLVVKGYKLYNVSNIKEYQHNSIYYVIDKLSRDNLPVIDEVINDNNFIKIEVKNSFTALKTGRLAYELTTSTELNDRNRLVELHQIQNRCPCRFYGPVVQLGERLICIQVVVGSSPTCVHNTIGV